MAKIELKPVPTNIRLTALERGAVSDVQSLLALLNLIDETPANICHAALVDGLGARKRKLGLIVASATGKAKK